MSPLIFGPAYLDRVVRVDAPLVDPARGERPLDASIDGRWLDHAAGLTLVDPLGNRLRLEIPLAWPIATGTIALSSDLAEPPGGWSRTVPAVAWQDDLGGMGAGYAASLGGELISVLGPADDPVSRQVEALLARAGVPHRPIRVAGKTADWTLLVTSGEHGDKLPIGFRGCHASLLDLGPAVDRPAPVRVVAALPNRLAEKALRGPADLRVFAPSSRNMVDRAPPIASFAGSIDILCCNRGEWEQLADREAVAAQVAILAVTDGPRGASLAFTTPDGAASRLEVPAFPRSRPPLDTNRAGEAFASALVRTLVEAGWSRGQLVEPLARRALERASAAASLVLDRLDFGFPTAAEVDRALQTGRV